MVSKGKRTIKKAKKAKAPAKKTGKAAPSRRRTPKRSPGQSAVPAAPSVKVRLRASTDRRLSSLAKENKATKSGFVVLLIEHASRGAKGPLTRPFVRSAGARGVLAVELVDSLLESDEGPMISLAVKLTSAAAAAFETMVTRANVTPDAVLAALIDEEHRRWLRPPGSEEEMAAALRRVEKASAGGPTPGELCEAMIRVMGTEELRAKEILARLDARALQLEYEHAASYLGLLMRDNPSFMSVGNGRWKVLRS